MKNEKTGRSEFLSTVCDFYIIVILAAVPLYTNGTYYLIGDTKYLVYRNVSILCLGLWLLVTLGTAGRKLIERGGRGAWKTTGLFSTVDVAVLSYGVCVLLSALHSAYAQTAWLGYRDWYMGALSQLFFVGSYFFLSRNYSGSAVPIYLEEAALAAVSLLAFVNRLGMDPIGVYAPYTERNWEYSHMLSTVGNINWLCGYLGVAAAFPLAGYLSSTNIKRTAPLFAVSAGTLALLLLQGSDTGILLTLAALGLCFLIGLTPLYRRHMKAFAQKGALLAAAVALLVGAMGQGMRLRGTIQAMPADSPLQGQLTWGGWWWMALFFAALFLAIRVLPERTLRVSVSLMAVLAGTGVLAGAVWYLAGHPFDGSWGSGRGSLWTAAWRGFREAGWLQKLIGAGPDCFAEYIYRIMSAQDVSQIGGYWKGSIYANAHNEWLTLLVDVGVLGAAAYLAVMVTALGRYRGMLLGIFAVVLYVLNSLVSFQQVMNVPILFAALGLCEYRLRRERERSAADD